MKHDVAGDPMSGLRWTRKTRLKVAQQLTKSGIPIGKTTVGVLLNKMDFSLRVNRKKLCSGNQTPEKRRMRNMQFGYIRRMREQFTTQAEPVISVDTKKKENIGNFKNAGTALILADSGGSNAAKSTMWKYYLQKKICNPFKLSVTVCHYPTGASKWNPIEHRLFGPISKNWEGIPLKTLETVLNPSSTVDKRTSTINQ